jgi:hypothetical protein
MVVMPKPANPTTAGFPLGAVLDMFWPSLHFSEKGFVDELVKSHHSLTGSIFFLIETGHGEEPPRS